MNVPQAHFAMFSWKWMAALVVIFLFVMFRSHWGKVKPSFWGKDFLTILTLYAPVRFFLEFLRANDVYRHQQPDMRYWGLTPAQYVSLGLFLMCIGIWVYVLAFRKNQPLKS